MPDRLARSYSCPRDLPRHGVATCKSRWHTLASNEQPVWRGIAIGAKHAIDRCEGDIHDQATTVAACTMALSAIAVALLAGTAARAAHNASHHDHNPSRDAAVLNTALALELEAINPYELGAHSKLLEKPALTVAVQFQGDHVAHRDRLISVIKTLDATPVQEKLLRTMRRSSRSASSNRRPMCSTLRPASSMGARHASKSSFLRRPRAREARWTTCGR